MLDFKHMLTLKQTRNAILSSTDKCLFEDYEINGVTITAEQKQEVLLYRKQLKDLPSNVDHLDDCNDVEYPTPPAWFKG